MLKIKSHGDSNASDLESSSPDCNSPLSGPGGLSARGKNGTEELTDVLTILREVLQLFGERIIDNQANEKK